MRSYVPNVSSNSNICQDLFETKPKIAPDTLEQIFRIGVFLGYGFDNATPPRATDIRRAAPESRTKEHQ